MVKSVFMILVAAISVAANGATWTVWPNKDASAASNYPTWNDGASAYGQIGLGGTAGYQYNGMWLSFDLPSNLAGNTVISATLTLTPRYTDGPLTIGVNVMTRDWAEGTSGYNPATGGVDYYHYDGVNQWTDGMSLGYKDRVLDGGGVPIVYGSAVFPNAPYPGDDWGVAPVSITMTDAVQYWANGGANYGIFLQTLGSDYWKFTQPFFKEKGNGLQPVLEIVYDPTKPYTTKKWSSTPSKDASADSNWARYNMGKASTMTVGGYSPSGGYQTLGAWLAWNLPSDLGGTVKSATLRLKQNYCEGGQSSMKLGVNLMNHDWLEGTGTGAAQTYDGVDFYTYNGTNGAKNWTQVYNSFGALLARFSNMGYSDRVLSANQVPVVFSSVNIPKYPNATNDANDVVIDMTSAVQHWASGGANYGIFLEGALGDKQNSNYVQFYTRESVGKEPVLTIEYDPFEPYVAKTVNLVATQDTEAQIVSEYNWGTYIFVDVVKQPNYNYNVGFIKWELPANLAGKTILDANIHLYCRQASSDTPVSTIVQAHAVKVPWLEGTSYSGYSDDGVTWETSDGWNYWPHLDTTIASNQRGEPNGGGGYLDTELDATGKPIVYGQKVVQSLVNNDYDLGLEFEIPIKELVQKWVDGDLANNGVRLNQVIDGNTVMIQVWSSEARDYELLGENWAPRLIINYAEPDCNDWTNKLAGDLNLDCYVDIKDFSQLASQWLMYGDALVADIDNSDNSNRVDFKDLKMMVLDWLGDSLLD